MRDSEFEGTTEKQVLGAEKHYPESYKNKTWRKHQSFCSRLVKALPFPTTLGGPRFSPR